MPDWRNPEKYAYTEGLRLHDWAWEFLRRNPAYRLAWDRFLVIAAVDKRAYLDAGGLGSDWPVSEALNAAYDSASKEFGLVSPIDPDLSALEADGLKWWEAVGVTILETWNVPRRDDRPWPGHPKVIGLSFDFFLPLEAQIEQAKETLFNCRDTLKKQGYPWEEYKPKVRVERWRFLLYLRLLDAERAGASLGEMARRLFKGKGDPRKSAKPALAQARKMSEGLYHELLLMANRKP